MTVASSSRSGVAEVVRCAHCNLPVPPGLINESAGEQFCCHGCESVYSLLHGVGLEGYYKVRDAVDPVAQPASTTGSAYEELDDPAFQRVCVDNLPGGQAKTDLLLEGMHCAACVWLIERLPRVCPGVLEARANIRSRSAQVRYQPDQVRLSQIARALDKLGYAAHPARGAKAREARAREDRRFLIRVGVAGAIAGNVMLMAIALYGGALDGISPFWENTFRYYSMALGLLALLWPGRVFFVGALAALRTRTAHLDIPIALALGVGGVWGAYNTLAQRGEIYFDSLAVLIFLLLVGRWVQHRQQRNASDQVELMLTLTPTSAVRVGEDGTQSRVPIEAIEEGMLVLVEAGGSIPADGVIESGATSIDNALLTGESRPVACAPGSAVAAGATNLRAPITVRVTAVGESTRAAKLMALVAAASADKAPIVLFADRVAGRFVLIVITLALLTFVYWAYTAGVHRGIELATALLIVTCPCALGLATPMAMSIAMGRAASSGILVKSAAAIETMAKPASRSGLMILDKTGTLTQGRTRVVERRCDAQLLTLAAGLEAHSNHPIARAIAALVDEQDRQPATDIDQTTGAGIAGVVDGCRVRAGSPEFIDQMHPLDEATGRDVESALAAALTPVVIWGEGIGFGVLGIGDPLREDAPRAAEALRVGGWDLHLCSGDHPAIAAHIARQAGITSAQGAVGPEAKADFVRTLRNTTGAPVVMVGDGVNDAAALAVADVGIAVHGGAEASLEAADIYLTRQGVAPIVDLASLAVHTMRTIRMSLCFSVVYNAIAATLAMTGVINALLAAIIMPVSSLTVVAMSTRPWRRPEPPVPGRQEVTTP